LNHEKLKKEAVRLQLLMKLTRQYKPAKVGVSKFVETSHGKIRVLEYGFESKEIEPLFIDMHCGGYIFYTADVDEPMNLFFREQTGAKIVSIDYPKAPKYQYPIALEASYDIVKHYACNAEKYNINPDNIGIVGHSSGANFATVICIKAKEKKEFSLKYQVLNCPPCDMTIDATDKRISQAKGALPLKLLAMFDACYYDNNAEMAKSPYLSPIFATKEQLSGLPPALIIVAGEDSLHDEGVRYSDILRDAGVQVEFHDFEKYLHVFSYSKDADGKEGWEVMANFIRRQVKNN